MVSVMMDHGALTSNVTPMLMIVVIVELLRIHMAYVMTEVLLMVVEQLVVEVLLVKIVKWILLHMVQNVAILHGMTLGSFWDHVGISLE